MGELCFWVLGVLEGDGREWTSYEEMGSNFIVLVIIERDGTPLVLVQV